MKEKHRIVTDDVTDIGYNILIGGRASSHAREEISDNGKLPERAGRKASWLRL